MTRGNSKKTLRLGARRPSNAAPQSSAEDLAPLLSRIDHVAAALDEVKKAKALEETELGDIRRVQESTLEFVKRASFVGTAALENGDPRPGRGNDGPPGVATRDRPARPDPDLVRRITEAVLVALDQDRPQSPPSVTEKDDDASVIPSD